MRTLHLLRHAKASWDDPTWSDLERPLTERGRRDATNLAARLGRSGTRPDLVLCSPALRTRQTLDLVAPGLGLPVQVAVDEAIYAASEKTLWHRVLELPDAVDEVLIVGHNPGLHELAVSLAGSGDDQQRSRLREKLPTCAFVTAVWDEGSWASLRPGSAVLHDYVRPRDI